MGILLLITQGASLVASLVNPSIQMIAEIRSIFKGNGFNYDIEIKGYQNGAIVDDTATLALVDQWKKDNGFTD